MHPSLGSQKAGAGREGLRAKPCALAPLKHPNRKEIARYVLARGLEADQAPPVRPRGKRPPIAFPENLAPAAKPISPKPQPVDRLPKADVVVVTWTADEADALARVLTPGVGRVQWYPYARRFASYKDQIRHGAPALNVRRLGSYMPVALAQKRVLCFKSELHLNQDGVRTGEGTASLPVNDLFKQIIDEANPALILTVGTAGSVTEEFGLGDVVITRAAKFRLQDEFRSEPFKATAYRSNWEIPTKHLKAAEKLMAPFAEDLREPPFGPPTKSYDWPGPLLSRPLRKPKIRLDGRDMRAFHPILTTDFFEYGTSENRLDRFGCGVEMGDAVLGLACSELEDPPNWGVVRNMSDPVINGALPTKDYRLNEQTTWAVGYYTAYGMITSICGAIATWAIIAGLD